MNWDLILYCIVISFQLSGSLILIFSTFFMNKEQMAKQYFVSKQLIILDENDKIIDIDVKDILNTKYYSIVGFSYLFLGYIISMANYNKPEMLIGYLVMYVILGSLALILIGLFICSRCVNLTEPKVKRYIEDNIPKGTAAISYENTNDI